MTIASRIHLVILFLVMLTSAVAVPFVYAAPEVGGVPIVDVQFPCPPDTEALGLGACETREKTDVGAYIVRLYQFGIGIAGLLAVAMIVVGSLFFTFAGGNADRQREGKEMITSALWGIALLFGSYFILNTINPELVTLNSPTLPEDVNRQATSTPPSTDCGPFENISVWSGVTTVGTGNLQTTPVPGTAQTASCAVRKVTVLSTFDIDEGDGNYYEEDERIDAGEEVWLYPYFREGTDPKTTARCLIYSEKPDKSDSFNASSSNEIDLADDGLQLCTPRTQASTLFTRCTLWKLTYESAASPSGPFTPFELSVPVSSAFDYPNSQNPPPTTFRPNSPIPDTNICYTSYCRSVLWTCIRG